MTKENLTLLLIVLAFSTPAFGQRETAEFKDGTRIDYEVTEKNPDNKHKINISFLFLDGLNASYLLSNKFYVNANYAYWKYGVDGILFLHSFEKQTSRNVPVGEQFTGYNTVKYYMIKPQLTLKTYIGLHAGFKSLDYSKQLITMQPQDLKNQEIYLGVALTRLKYSKVIIYHNTRNEKLYKTMQIMLYADAIYYSNRVFAGEDIQQDKNVNNYSKSFGYRIYSEFKSNSFMNRDAGLSWKLGVQSGPYTNSSLLVGVGFYFGV